MISKTFSSNKPTSEEAFEEIRKKVKDEPNFSPDLAFFYSTLKYYGDFNNLLEKISNLVGSETPIIGGTVDGVVYPHELRTDGCFLVLCKDNEARFSIIKSEKKGSKGFNELSEKISNKNANIKAALLHYPLNFISNRRKLMSTIARGKYYDFISSQNSLPKYAKRFSNYLQKNGIFNPPNKVLKELSNKVDFPIIGVNLAHTEFKIGAPIIFSNNRVIRGGCSCLLIENIEPNVVYRDIYPEKPDEKIELNEYISENFKIIESLNLEFQGNVIHSINNKTPMKEINKIRETLELDEDKMIEGVERGKFPAEVPYGIFLKNKYTRGVSLVGVSDLYPFDLFPTYLDLENFSKTSMLGFEPLRRFDEFCSSLNNLNRPEKSFTFSIFDISSIESLDVSKIDYGGKLREKAKENYFSIITTPPSVYLPKKYWKYDYLPEVEENILFSGTGTNLSIEI